MPDLKMKILIADDFSTMRRIIRNILRQLGYENVEEAEDGNIALTKLRLDMYGLVIADWNMPNMTGIELLKSIRADNAIKDLPVLMVTAEAKQENVIAAIQSGVNNYIVKPFTAEILKEKIDKIFEKA